MTISNSLGKNPLKKNKRTGNRSSLPTVPESKIKMPRSELGEYWLEAVSIGDAPYCALGTLVSTGKLKIDIRFKFTNLADLAACNGRGRTEFDNIAALTLNPDPTEAKFRSQIEIITGIDVNKTTRLDMPKVEDSLDKNLFLCKIETDFFGNLQVKAITDSRSKN